MKQISTVIASTTSQSHGGFTSPIGAHNPRVLVGDMEPEHLYFAFYISHFTLPSSPHIAIIILNWNGLEDTQQCVDSVLKNSYPNYSIMIIDNASDNNEAQKIKDYINSKKITNTFPTVIHVTENNSNLGFAGGNNVGIKKALSDGADWIFLLNNDTTVDPNFLTNIISTQDFTFPKDSNIPNPGIVSTMMINYYDHNKLDNIGHDLLTTGDTIPRARNQQPEKYSILKTQNSQFQTTFGACAGAALYSAPMLTQIGLLDDDFFLNYEDSDLSLRAITSGWKTVFCPTSKVYHKINASIGKIKDTSYRIRSQRNQLWAYLHNTPWPVIILNLPWILFRDISVILISLITLRWTITKIFILSRYETLKSAPTIWKKRRKVMKHQKISWWNYWKNQKSFFTTYWEYFKEIVLERKSSVME
ncbi:MAG: glycosyltransferase family 2 protein [Candidatus Gracilibacteria bacterium]|nr:glycosyltransferase family 2 protein [Candidatus Gracilibacteria bacterium]